MKVALGKYSCSGCLPPLPHGQKHEIDEPAADYIGEKKVKCPQEEKECTWNGRIVALEAHQKDCEIVKTEENVFASLVLPRDACLSVETLSGTVYVKQTLLDEYRNSLFHKVITSGGVLNCFAETLAQAIKAVETQELRFFENSDPVPALNLLRTLGILRKVEKLIAEWEAKKQKKLEEENRFKGTILPFYFM